MPFVWAISFQATEVAQLPALQPSLLQPGWMVYAAFAISAGLALIRLVEFIARSQLSANLTRDLFLRYGDLGELLFLNAVLVSSKRPAFVWNFQAAAYSADGTQTIPLVLRHLGEPADRGSVIHDHYFFSSSPTDLVPVDTPVRRVFMLIASGFDNSLAAASQELRSAVLAHADVIRPALTNADQAGDSDANATTLAVGAITQARETFVNTYFDGIQFRPGRYTVRVTWSYRDANSRGLVKRERQECAKVSFTLAGDFRQQLREHVVQTSFAIVRQVVLPDSSVVFPEVVPQDIASP